MFRVGEKEEMSRATKSIIYKAQDAASPVNARHMRNEPW